MFSQDQELVRLVGRIQRLSTSMMRWNAQAGLQMTRICELSDKMLSALTPSIR